MEFYSFVFVKSNFSLNFTLTFITVGLILKMVYASDLQLVVHPNWPATKNDHQIIMLAKKGDCCFILFQSLPTPLETLSLHFADSLNLYHGVNLNI